MGWISWLLFFHPLAFMIGCWVIWIAYLLSPIDLIPDFIPVVGWTDDAFMFILPLFATLWFIGYSIFTDWKVIILVGVIIAGMIYFKLFPKLSRFFQGYGKMKNKFKIKSKAKKIIKI